MARTGTSHAEALDTGGVISSRRSQKLANLLPFVGVGHLIREVKLVRVRIFLQSDPEGPCPKRPGVRSRQDSSPSSNKPVRKDERPNPLRPSESVRQRNDTAEGMTQDFDLFVTQVRADVLDVLRQPIEGVAAWKTVFRISAAPLVEQV